MSDYPMPLGGGHYELSSGDSVQGYEEAKAEQAVLDAETRREQDAVVGEISCIKESEFGGLPQYVCTECHWDTLVQGDELEAAFRARDHGLTHAEE